jgi:hypothetical protein
LALPVPDLHGVCDEGQEVLRDGPCDIVATRRPDVGRLERQMTQEDAQPAPGQPRATQLGDEVEAVVDAEQVRLDGLPVLF